jgi:DNA-binding LacI/PurR family transcriptional regulator
MVKKQATIKDVARMINVSVSTVSRVMNNLDRVSDDVRVKVKQAAKTLNYVPSGIAVSMVKGKSKIILVVVPDIINEYYTAVVHGVEEVTRNNGYSTVLYASNLDKDKETELFQGPMVKMIEGAIVVPACMNTEVYKQFGKPVVLVDRYIEGSDLPGVVIDNFSGSYEIIQLLIHYGHQKIGIVIGDLLFNIGSERYMGYEKALIENGITVNNDYVIHGDWYRNTGFYGMQKLLQLSDPPTAVFAANNLICIGCIEAIKRAGLIIGKDISLVGFDDHILAEFVNQGVTVVKRPTIEMGQIAARRLFYALQEKNICEKIVLGVNIVERGSIKQL